MTSRQSFSGQLGAISLAQVLSKLQTEALTGTVHVAAAFGPGRIWYTAGTLLDAEVEGTTGLKALDLLLAVSTGSFRVEHEPVERVRAVRATLAEILSRRPRLAEDFESLIRQLPPLSTRLIVDDGALASERIELDAQEGRLLQLVDGRRSIAEIVQSAGSFATETITQLGRWCKLGLLKPRGESVPPGPATARQPTGEMPAQSPGSTLTTGSPVPGRAPTTMGQFSQTRPGHGTPSDLGADPKKAPRPGRLHAGRTQLGVPRVSSNPPPRHSQPPPEDLRRTRLGVPGVSSNPPPRHSMAPAARAMTRPGFAMTAAPSTERLPKPANTRKGVPSSMPAAAVPPTPRVNPTAKVDLTRTALMAPERGPSTLALPSNRASNPPQPALNSERPRQTTEHSPLSSRLSLAGYHMAGKLRSTSIGDVYAAREGDQACHLLVIDQQENARQLVQTEKRVAAVFKHQHALVATAQGHEGKRAFLAYEALDGATLAALLDTEPDATRAALLTRVICDCLGALGAFHDFTDADGSYVGASHNAVLPENIIVGSDGRTRLSVFAEATFGAQATPLQDIHALGKVLWQALTGRALVLPGSAALKPSELTDTAPEFLDAICRRAIGADDPDHFTTARSAEQQLTEVAKQAGCWATREEVGAWVQSRQNERREAPRVRRTPTPEADVDSGPGTAAASSNKVTARRVKATAIGVGLLAAGALTAAGGVTAAISSTETLLSGALGWTLAGFGTVGALGGAAVLRNSQRRARRLGGSRYGKSGATAVDDAPPSEAYPDDEPAPISTSQVVLYDAAPPWSKDSLPLRDNAADLSTKLLQYHQDGCTVIGVTGPSKSRVTRATSAAHLAYKLSRMSALRVLLLEADFVSPYLHRAMAVTMPIGVSASRQMDGTGQEQDDHRVHAVSCLTNLHLLAEGVIRSPGALLSPRTAHFLQRVRGTYDVVVMSGPSMDLHPDYGAFEKLVDGVVRIAPEGRNDDLEVRPAQHLRFSVRHVAPNLDA